MVRRARPLLGTLVEVGVVVARSPDAAEQVEAAFDAIAQVQARLSRFEAASDIARFNMLEAGDALDDVSADTRTVLIAAAALQAQSDGLFDVSLGSAFDGWRLEGARLVKLDARTRLDLGGIGKGHAVDRGVDALRACGCQAGWVNAGGDLRAFGGIDVPVLLRDEQTGGVRPVAIVRDGAFATSRFRAGARSVLAGRARASHVSVAAPTALLADALTKIVARSGDGRHPLLARHGACATVHARACEAEPA